MRSQPMSSERHSLCIIILKGFDNIQNNDCISMVKEYTIARSLCLINFFPIVLFIFQCLISVNQWLIFNGSIING